MAGPDFGFGIDTPPRLYDPQANIQIQVCTPHDHPNPRTLTFTIHKNFVCYYSSFFREQFTLLHQKAEKPILHLECPRPEVFGYLVAWIYTKEITMHLANILHLRQSIWLWLLAEQTGTAALQNATISYMEDLRHLKWFTNIEPGFLTHVYNVTSQNSPLRRYLVDTWDEKLQDTDASLYPPELLVDLVNSRARRVKFSKIPGIDLRDYFISRGSLVKKENMATRDSLRIPLGPLESADHMLSAPERVIAIKIEETEQVILREEVGEVKQGKAKKIIPSKPKPKQNQKLKTKTKNRKNPVSDVSPNIKKEVIEGAGVAKSGRGAHKAKKRNHLQLQQLYVLRGVEEQLARLTLNGLVSGENL